MKYEIEALMEESGVKFGTSGARGLADAMTDAVCYSYTVAFLQHLEQVGNITKGSEVAIAGDLRPSSPRICAAVAKAVEDKGYKPVYCGEVPSPAVAYYGLVNKVPSVMVTGSHIPDDRNGIKYNTPLGEILKEDEQGIRSQSVELLEGLVKADGFFNEAYELPAIYTEAEDLFLKRYTDFFASEALAGLKLGVYEHSCVGRDVLKKIYSALGANVTGLGRSEKFIPVDTEAIRPEDVKLAAEWAASGDFDAILSADGDCDRPLISDEKGHWLRGDVAGILCARYLKADAVATPVSCNTAVESCGAFESVSRTRIGSPYVIASMKEASAKGANMVVGYEANGGFLTNSDFIAEGKTLDALPTRDAVILHIALLADAKAKAIKLSELVNELPARFTASDRLKEFPTEKSKAKLAEFNTDDFAKDAKKIERLFGHLCGKVVSMDDTDGIRITFENDEIIHLRPSGNAPELRCYNEADSEERAVELNAQCIELMSTWI
ncbi:phosphomannomutase [Lentisphaera marina]|uniref:phosphomannomutase n=1 Tax=Lentisphaera marina TaxID=1111041 RepID=UPI0023669521|nr:phosphomannomutase [Lentisphaera marina]MDD7984940.1 phosphomannomutase [Lentisphaera marina]